MATSQAGIDAAYATEINDCSFRADAGPKKSARPQEFCASVDVAGAFTVQGQTDVAGAFTVQGQTFVPTPLLGTIVLASGPPITPTPPASEFTNITVKGTATIANAVMDAGSY